MEELEAYKLMHPAKQLPGYALSAFKQEFPQYARVSDFAFEGELEKTYQERAYFASTEAEACRILTDFQTYFEDPARWDLHGVPEFHGTESDIAF
ncbi:MAG: hypothetical protein LBJ41_07030 [Treponema sp.]|nr:hypothetical protein [Treponema sp.]